MKKVNVCEILSIIYILVYTLWMSSKVGDIPLYPELPYEWTMPLMGFVSIIIPLILGYLAGVWERRKY